MNRFVRSGKVRKYALVAAAVALLAGVFTAGVSFANHQPTHVKLTGKGLISRTIQTENGHFSHQAADWVYVPSTSVAVSVPSGTVRLVSTRFTASAACSNTSGAGWPCYLRVVAKKSTSATVFELYPRAGTEQTITHSPGYPIAVAVDRSIRLGSGSWVVSAQVRTANTSTSVALRARHFTVDVNYG